MNKIVFLIGNIDHLGGAQKVCVNLANELVRRGLEIEIRTLSSPGDVDQSSSYSAFERTSFKATRYRAVCFEFYRFVRRAKDRTILVFSYEFLFLLWLTSFIASPKFAVFRNINTSSKLLGNIEVNWKKRVLQSVLSQCVRYPNLIVNQSIAMDEDFRKVFKINSTLVINNPVVSNGTVFVDEAVKIDSIYILFVGRLEKQKDLDFAIDSFSRYLDKSKSKVTLVICGEGTEKERLKSKVVSCGLSNSIVFLGERREIASLYENAHCLVLTSLYEGFPNVVLEANSYGTPVVSLDIESGPSEIIEDGFNGLLVKERQISEFADAIDRSFDIDWKRNEIVSRTISKYGMEVIASKYELILNR